MSFNFPTSWGPFPGAQFPYTQTGALNMDWVLWVVKNLIAEWKQTAQDWKTQQEAFDSLKSYVEEYFKNLDVQDEINNKLDQMLTDGSLDEIISKNLAWYVMADAVLTPGLSDYSDEIETLINTYGTVVFSEKTYPIGSIVTITRNNVHIIGNNCTFQGSTTAFNSLFNIAAGCKNIWFDSVNFSAGTSVDIEEPNNWCLVFSAPSTYDQDNLCNNITIKNCSFNGGNGSLSLNTCKNACVIGCTFGNARQGSTFLNSGYNILLQSCENVVVNNCIFTNQLQVRHSVYVSLNQSYSPIPQSKDIIIDNCNFDSSAQEYFASITSQINVRSVDACTINNCSFTAGTGISAVGGDISDVESSLVINGCSFNNMHYRTNTQAPSESRQAINLNFQSSPLKARIVNCNFNSADSTNFNTASLGAGTQGVFKNNYINNFGEVIHNSSNPWYFSDNYKEGAGGLISIQRADIDNGFITWSNDAPNGSVIVFSGGSISLGVIDPRFVQYNVSYSGGTYNLSRGNTHKTLSITLSYSASENQITLTSNNISNSSMMIGQFLTYSKTLYVERTANSRGSLSVQLYSDPEHTTGYAANFAFTIIPSSP